MNQASAYDIDKWDPVSLTWRPEAHAADDAQARRLATAYYGREKTAKFRVRRKADSKIIFEIGEGKASADKELFKK